MEQWEPPMAGTLRISNPKTLERWIHQGKYQEQLDAGYIFAPACGRFRTEVCTCFKCRRPNAAQALKEVIAKHFKG